MLHVPLVRPVGTTPEPAVPEALVVGVGVGWSLRPEPATEVQNSPSIVQWEKELERICIFGFGVGLVGSGGGMTGKQVL